MEFIHLHNHTENSLLDGVSTVSEWAKRAKELGMSALSVTDHGNLNGAQQLLFACKQEGLKPIIGVEAYIVKDRFIKKKEFRNHLILLAKNTDGYHNLLKLISEANLTGFYNKPRIDFELLKKYSNGLIALSACIAGAPQSAIKSGDEELAIIEMNKYQELFGEDYYMEIMLFPEKGFIDWYPKIVRVAQKQGVPLVLTNDCHYLYQKDYLLQDILFKIKQKATFKNAKSNFKFSLKCLWMKSLPEILQVWKKYYSKTISKEALQEAVKNTVVIANKVELYNIDTSNKYPAIFVKGKRLCEKEINTIIKKKALIGWKKKGFNREEHANYFKRLKYELKIITDKGMAAYFIILADVIKWANKQGILVGYGRGSVAGCLLAYLLGIHNVDPIKHRLLFERFINKSSDSMPDIDVDFDARYREKIKQYIITKYGSDKVGEIATYGMMKIKMAIKDIARVYGFDYHFINDITKRIDNNAELSKQELSHLIGDWKNKDIIIGLALRMQGQTRHISIHPAGLVITPTALTDYLPLQRYKDKIITGWTEGVYRREITSLGLVKYDILGLKTLSIVADCIKFIKERHDKIIHLDKIPLDNSEVYKLYRDDKNIGIFQCESNTMRGLIKKLKPNRFEDIVALLALDRPAPLSIGVFDNFLIYRKNKDTYKRFHPIVWEILKDTHGVLLYQEQVLNLVKKLAHFTTEQRLVMKKLLKKPPKGKAEYEEFLKKQKELGYIFVEKASTILTKDRSEELWRDIKAFGAYGFNKSHSCSYALLSYATMWLKTYYPIEFYAALLNHTTEDEKFDIYRREINQEGIEILRADINKSKDNFIIDGKNIRYGLCNLKGIGKGVEHIISKQPYNSIEAFLLHAINNKKYMNKRVVLALIKAGAFDEFCTRGKALHLYRQRSDKKYISNCEELNDFQKLEGEKEVYGYYFSGNMKQLIGANFKDKKYLQLDVALRQKAGTRVKTFAKVERVNVTEKAIFINVASNGIKTVMLGWRDVIYKFKDKFKIGDIIVADVYRMDYKGKRELLIKEFSKIEKVGG